MGLIEAYYQFQITFYRLEWVRVLLGLSSALTLIRDSFLIIKPEDRSREIDLVESVVHILDGMQVLKTGDGKILILKEEMGIFLRDRVKEMFNFACEIATQKQVIDTVYEELGLNYSEGKDSVVSPQQYVESIRVLVNAHNSSVLEGLRDYERELAHTQATQETLIFHNDLENINDYLIPAPVVNEQLLSHWVNKVFQSHL
jgi:hypothetical protein